METTATALGWIHPLAEMFHRTIRNAMNHSSNNLSTSQLTTDSPLQQFTRVEGLLADVFVELGITTVGRLAGLSMQTVRGFKGVGEKKLQRVESLIQQAQEIVGSNDCVASNDPCELDELSDIQWEDVPFVFPKRVTDFLDKYCLTTVHQLRQLARTAIFRDPTNEEFRHVIDEPNFSEGSFRCVCQQVNDLNQLGLTGFRYGTEGPPTTTAELATQVAARLDGDEWAMLEERSTGMNVADIGKKRGLSRQTAKNKVDGIFGKCRRFHQAVESLLSKLKSQIACDGFLSQSQCMTLLSAESFQQVRLVFLLSDVYHRIDDQGCIRFLNDEQVKALSSKLTIAAETKSITTKNGLIHLDSLPSTNRAEDRQTAAAIRHLRRLGIDCVNRTFLNGAIGNKWLLVPMRKQLVASKVNGMSKAALDPMGLFESAEKLKEFLGSEAELCDNGRFRRPGETFQRIDQVIGVLENASVPLKAEEILDALNWDLPKEQLLSRYLTPSREIIAVEIGQYAHASFLGLTPDQVEAIMRWGSSLVVENQTSIEGEVLFKLHQDEFGEGKLNSSYQLVSIISKCDSVRRICNTTRLACRESFDDSELYLSSTHPDLASQWHSTRNLDSRPDNVRSASSQLIWWQCEKGHVFSSTPAYRTTASSVCPGCTQRWTQEKLRHFVRSLQPHLSSLTPAEIYAIAQQNGLAKSEGSGREIIKKLVSGSLPQEWIEEFADQNHLQEDADPFSANDPQPRIPLEQLDEVDFDHENVDSSEEIDIECLEMPIVRTKNALEAIDEVQRQLGPGIDSEAVEYLIESAKAKLWSDAYQNEQAAVQQARRGGSGDYSKAAQSAFLSEYEAARSLEIPAGYSFRIQDELCLPNLMQRRVAVDVRERRRVGNWSGTGAGKTLSAILATRVVDSKFTVICCPNAVVGQTHSGWMQEISRVFPDSEVCAKTLSPRWTDSSDHRYLVLNYEQFQQPQSESFLNQLVQQNRIEFVVIDEVHYAKQRDADAYSKRRRLIQGMLAMASKKNPELYVLGLSATPVINNLQEGKSMVEMITGVEHPDLKPQASVDNCMKLHQKIVTLGTRWKPNYRANLHLDTPDCDCSDVLDEIRALGKRQSPLDVEKILTRSRLPIILDRLAHGKQTIVYTHYVDQIDQLLAQAIRQAGYSVGFHTGQLKNGLEAFKAGTLDVLIGSSAIGTGVDGLQFCCSQLIINSLPWTNAEFEQLIGRIWRQGQVDDRVDVVVPVTYATVGGQRWSYCDSKLQRIRYKRTIADAAVDGVVPQGNLRSEKQAQQDIMHWLQRLDEGNLVNLQRRPVQAQLKS